MRLTHLCLGVMLVSSGCYLGGHAEIPASARLPAGAEVTLETTSEDIEGELLAVRPRALVLRTPNPDRIVIVPLLLIVSGRADLVGSFRSNSLRPATLEKLRLVSRFPQGMTAELESSLVREYGLSGVEMLSP